MAQRTRPREKKPGTDDAETQSMSAAERDGVSMRRGTACCLLIALLCMTLSASALARDAATEMSTQVIPSAATLKCNEAEYKLVVVRANMPAQPAAETAVEASALGVALVPLGAGDARVFARYWFSPKGRDGAPAGQQLLKRDNDNGQVGTKLMNFDEKSFSDNVANFFQGCADDRTTSAVLQALTQINPRSSVEEVQTVFHTAGLELDLKTATSEPRKVDKTPDITDAGQMLFAQVVRESLLGQLGRGALPAVSPSPLPTSPKVDEPAAALDELKVITQKLEENGRLAASISTLLSILLGVLVATLVATLSLAALFYFSPAWQRKIFFRPDDAAEIRRQVVGELYEGLRKISDSTEARERLEKILDEAEQRLNEAGGDPSQSECVYRDLQTALRAFCLSLPQAKDGGAEGETDVTFLRQLISDNFGIAFAGTDMKQGLADATTALNQKLRLLVGDAPPRLLPRMEVARQHVEAMWSGSSSEPCPDGALTLLRQQWESIQNILQPLKEVSPERVLAFTRESAALFSYLSEKFSQQSQGSFDLKSKVERFFNDLDTIQSKYLDDGAQGSPTPDDILVNLDEKLTNNRRAIADFESLSEDVGALREELPSSNGTQSDPIAQATQMAKNHKAALELLKDYRPAGDDDNILETARAIQTKIRSATLVVTEKIPKACGTIDVLVSDLAGAFDSKVKLAKKAEEFKEQAERLGGELTESKAQAEDSTRLAGALSQYVNLSAGADLGPEQVRNALQRFSTGERTHRQLRLRLSAATAALDEAFEDVRGAGREDVLDALRVGDFTEQLRDLLTNMEDFRGDAIWKDCLSSGFSEQWLHNLLRAELLARTYFTESETLSGLIDPLAEAGSALRVTMRHFKVRVSPLSLLSKPPAGARVDYEVDPMLSSLPEARWKVQDTLRERSRSKDGLNFIVDVSLFPFQSESAEKFGGRVIAVSPSEWAEPGRA